MITIIEVYEMEVTARREGTMKEHETQPGSTRSTRIPARTKCS